MFSLQSDLLDSGILVVSRMGRLWGSSFT